MSQEAVEKVLGRLLTDDSFRVRAGKFLRAACREEGFNLSEEELQLVGKFDVTQLDSISETLDGDLKRFMTRLPGIDSRKSTLKLIGRVKS